MGRKGLSVLKAQSVLRGKRGRLEFKDLRETQVQSVRQDRKASRAPQVLKALLVHQGRRVSLAKEARKVPSAWRFVELIPRP